MEQYEPLKNKSIEKTPLKDLICMSFPDLQQSQIDLMEVEANKFLETELGKILEKKNIEGEAGFLLALGIVDLMPKLQEKLDEIYNSLH